MQNTDLQAAQYPVFHASNEVSATISFPQRPPNSFPESAPTIDPDSLVSPLQWQEPLQVDRPTPPSALIRIDEDLSSNGKQYRPVTKELILHPKHGTRRLSAIQCSPTDQQGIEHIPNRLLQQAKKEKPTPESAQDLNDAFKETM